MASASAGTSVYMGEFPILTPGLMAFDWGWNGGMRRRGREFAQVPHPVAMEIEGGLLSGCVPRTRSGY